MYNVTGDLDIHSEITLCSCVCMKQTVEGKKSQYMYREY